MSFNRYYINEPIPNIEILSISHSKFERDWNSFQHAHNYTEIMFVLSGRGTLNTANEIIELKENDIIFINEYCLHTEYSNDLYPLEYFIIGLQNILIGQKIDDEISYNIFKNKFANINCAALFNQIKMCSNIQSFINRIKIYSIVFNMLSNFSNHQELFFTQKNSLFDNHSLNNQTSLVEIYQLKHFIENHYASEINLTKIAKKFHISESYLIRKFKKDIGDTPIVFCIKQRIKQAKHLLSTTNMDITQISMNVGFNSSSYFSKEFKKYTGLTPSDFKRNNE